MKKNFFKKLSFVMALAMIVSIVAPAASAFAATTPSLYVTTKYLYLNDEGTNKVNEYDFNVKNKVTGSTYKWTSNNEAVAEVDAKTGEVVGLSVGKATITVKITLPTKKTKTLTATVKVRDNIETLAVSNAPTAAIAVDQELNLNRSFTTFNNSTTKTSSITRWTVEGTDATIAADSGIFKSSKAGTYKVTATAFQSVAKYEAWLTSKDATLALTSATVEIKVANEIKAVSQVSLNTVKVEFKAPMDAVTAADLSVSKVVSGTPVKQTIKSITAVDGSNKTAWTVVMYNNFSTNTVYQVGYTGLTAQSFTTATTNVADVTEVKVTPATAVVNTATDVIVKLYNAAGVDITTSDLIARVTLENSSPKAYLNSTGTNLTTPAQVTLFTIGDTTTIKATFHTYDYDNTTGLEKNTISGSTTVTCTAVAAVSAGSLSAWTIATSAPTDKFASVNHAVAAGDTTYKLYVKSVKDTTTYTNTSLAAGNDNSANWRFTSSDGAVLFITGNTLYPIKAGSATVLVEYSTDNFVTTTVVDAITVAVSAARTATNLKLDSYSFSLSTSTNVNDSKTIGIDVEDQYGIDMTEKDVVVSNVSSDATISGRSIVSGTVSSTATSVTFVGAGATPGVYNYKITANGISRNVIITVTAPKDASGNALAAASSASYYRLFLDDADASFDTKLATSGTPSSVVANFFVRGYAANNVAQNNQAATGGSYIVKIVKPDGTEVQAQTYVTLSTTATGSSIALSVPGTTAVKQATGTWIIKLYSASNNVLLDQISFTVTDTQTAPVVTTSKLETSAATVTAAIQDCFAATYLDATVTSSLYVTTDDLFGTGNTIYVKNVRYKDTVNGVVFTVAVNTQIKMGGTGYNGTTIN